MYHFRRRHLDPEHALGYFEKLDKALADVHQALSKEQTERPIFVREGSKIIRLRREEILFLEGYGDYVKVHRINGSPCSRKSA